MENILGYKDLEPSDGKRTMPNETRRELSGQELQEAIKNGDISILDNVQASGMVTIKDKDGNVRAELPIVSLETQELEDAT